MRRFRASRSGVSGSVRSLSTPTSPVTAPARASMTSSGRTALLGWAAVTSATIARAAGRWAESTSSLSVSPSSVRLARAMGRPASAQKQISGCISRITGPRDEERRRYSSTSRMRGAMLYDCIESLRPVQRRFSAEAAS